MCYDHWQLRDTEKLNPHSDLDIKVKLFSDGAPHIHTHRNVILQSSGKSSSLSDIKIKRLSLQLHTHIHTPWRYTRVCVPEASTSLGCCIQPVPRLQNAATRPHTPPPPVSLGRDIAEYTNRYFGVTTRPLAVFEAEWNIHIVFWGEHRICC